MHIMLGPDEYPLICDSPPWLSGQNLDYLSESRVYIPVGVNVCVLVDVCFEW